MHKHEQFIETSRTKLVCFKLTIVFVSILSVRWKGNKWSHSNTNHIQKSDHKCLLLKSRKLLIHRMEIGKQCILLCIAKHSNLNVTIYVAIFYWKTRSTAKLWFIFGIGVKLIGLSAQWKEQQPLWTRFNTRPCATF